MSETHRRPWLVLPSSRRAGETLLAPEDDCSANRPLMSGEDYEATTMTTSTDAGFYIAPHGIDGEQAGIGFWENSKLSGVWLGLCTEFLDAHGAVFDASWGGKLH